MVAAPCLGGLAKKRPAGVKAFGEDQRLTHRHMMSSQYISLHDCVGKQFVLQDSDGAPGGR